VLSHTAPAESGGWCLTTRPRTPGSQGISGLPPGGLSQGAGQRNDARALVIGRSRGLSAHHQDARRGVGSEVQITQFSGT
jgi:hypothetical protein